jgi:hypothetical protein
MNILKMSKTNAKIQGTKLTIIYFEKFQNMVAGRSWKKVSFEDATSFWYSKCKKVNVITIS